MIWAIALATALAAWDAGERWLATQVRRPIVLLPAQPPSETERGQIQTRLAAERGIDAATWQSPAELTRRLRQTRSDPGWSALFPQDEAWTPWVLEVWPRDPLRRPDDVRAFVARRRQEGEWQLVLADGAALDTWTRRRAIAWGVWGVWAALVAMGGALALARQAAPQGNRLVAWGWSTGLSVAAVAAVWSMVPILGGPADTRSLALGLAVAFALAGLVAPMLRLRGQITREPQRSSVSILLGEASDERPNPRPRQ